jgi:hypothetical protein
MTRRVRSQVDLICEPGKATPPPEPATRQRPPSGGRRIGATLPVDTYVRFKAYVARHGTTGEQVILDAIAQLIGSR